MKLYFRAKPNVRSYLHLLKKLLGRQDGSVDKGAAAKPDHLGSIHEAHVMERENQLPKLSSYLHICTMSASVQETAKREQT